MPVYLFNFFLLVFIYINFTWRVQDVCVYNATECAYMSHIKSGEYVLIALFSNVCATPQHTHIHIHTNIK